MKRNGKNGANAMIIKTNPETAKRRNAATVAAQTQMAECLMKYRPKDVAELKRIVATLKG